MYAEWKVFRVTQKGPDDTQAFTLISCVTSEEAAQAVIRLCMGAHPIYAVGPETLITGVQVTELSPIQYLGVNLSLH